MQFATASGSVSGKGQETSSNPLVLLKRKFKPHPKKPAVKIELESIFFAQSFSDFK